MGYIWRKIVPEKDIGRDNIKLFETFPLYVKKTSGCFFSGGYVFDSYWVPKKKGWDLMQP